MLCPPAVCCQHARLWYYWPFAPVYRFAERRDRLLPRAAGLRSAAASTAARGKKPDTASIRRYLLPLLISGGMIGFNWMLLFEAYRYTSIAVATLCYYTAPVMLILASPLVFREQFTWRQLVCVALAACGMVLVSGVLDGGTLPDGTIDRYCTCHRLGSFVRFYHRREPENTLPDGRIRQNHRAAWRGGTGHGAVSGTDRRIFRPAI